MTLRLPWWATAIAAAVVLGGIYAAVQFGKGQGAEVREAELSRERAEAADSASEAWRDRYDSLEAHTDSVTARLEASADSIEVVFAGTAEDATTIINTLAEGHPALRDTLALLQAKVDSLESQHRQVVSRKDSTIAAQQAQIVFLEGLAEQERAAKVGWRETALKWQGIADPPWYKKFARGIPEAALKVGGAVLVWTLTPEDQKPYAVGGYGLGLATDLIF